LTLVEHCTSGCLLCHCTTYI